MSTFGTKQPTYNDGRTKQSFKDETDINKILSRAQKTGVISHLSKHQARYGDFSGFDFFEAQLKLSAGATIFADLPSEIRREFNQSPAEFFNYVNDPANVDRLPQLLPDLAAPGRQNLSVQGNLPADELTANVESDKLQRKVAQAPPADDDNGVLSAPEATPDPPAKPSSAPT